MAVRQAQSYIKEGYRWVVEIDLSKFFDRVNHDILMNRIARVIDDKPLLKLIRRYLNAGIMEDGLVKPRTEGVPQGSPLSPLLSNIMLTELDWELEKRGLKFCRYADDCNIFVKSEVAAKRALENITRYLEEVLKLRVNRDKSGTFRPCDSVFLGYTFSKGDFSRPVVAEKSCKRLAARLRKIFYSARGTSLKATIQRLTQVLRGWRNYFYLDTRVRFFQRLDTRIHRHLRKLVWLAWKNPRTRRREFLRRGFSTEEARKAASSGKGAWRNARTPIMSQVVPTELLVRLGLYSLSRKAICW